MRMSLTNTKNENDEYEYEEYYIKKYNLMLFNNE